MTKIARSNAGPHVLIEPRYITLDVAQRIYGDVARSTLDDLRAKGFPVVRIGRKPVVPVAAADAWMAEYFGLT